MAEAVVEERPQVPLRFYCHMCNVEISLSNSDYICPHCSGGFIEELPASAPTATTTAAATNQAEGTARSGSDGRDMRRLNDLEAIRGEIATLLMSRNGPNLEISFDAGNRRGNLITLGGGSGAAGGSSSNSATSVVGGGRVRHQTYDRLDNVLMDFLQSISGDADPAFGNSQMFFMGNPGDYAWGREGIDTIVTQLLNQMETSGPPPLAKEKIDEIPKVEITADEVQKKLQCSVCWEDFRLQEIVRKLPCSHIYHESCIVPWLDLHGTCPICRKLLATGDDDEDVDMTTENNSDYAMHSAMNNGSIDNRIVANNRNSNSVGNTNVAHNTAASSTQTNTNYRTQQNNIFNFSDGNDDLDFELE